MSTWFVLAALSPIWESGHCIAMGTTCTHNRGHSVLGGFQNPGACLVLECRHLGQGLHNREIWTEGGRRNYSQRFFFSPSKCDRENKSHIWIDALEDAAAPNLLAVAAGLRYEHKSVRAGSCRWVGATRQC